MNKMEHPEYGPREWLCFPNETNALQYPFVHRCRDDVDASYQCGHKLEGFAAVCGWSLVSVGMGRVLPTIMLQRRRRSKIFLG